MIHAIFCANMDNSILDLWNSFITAGSIELIVEFVEAQNPKTLNACWKAIWSDAVNNFKRFLILSGEVKYILQVVREIRESFLKTSSKRLKSKELEELLKSLIQKNRDCRGLWVSIIVNNYHNR